MHLFELDYSGFQAICCSSGSLCAVVEASHTGGSQHGQCQASKYKSSEQHKHKLHRLQQSREQ
jgi:hypothetical protein